jgi:hypothetical protein
MITEYQIANFKAFGSPQTLPIRPITLIFGPNSSGKSSIFQSLLMLKQTIESPENFDTPLLYKGDLVDLGSVREFIHKHEEERHFSFRIKIDSFIFEEVIRKDAYDGEIYDSDYYYYLNEMVEFLNNNFYDSGLEFVFNLNNNYLTQIKTNLFLGKDKDPLFIFEGKKCTGINLNHSLMQKYNDYDKEMIKSMFEELVKLEHNKSIQEIDINEWEREHFSISNIIEWKELGDKSESGDILEYRKFFPRDRYFDELKQRYTEKYEGEEKAYDEITKFTTIVSSCLEKNLRNILYIGPMREWPDRKLISGGSKTDYVGKTGKYVQDILISDNSLLDKINQRFYQFDIPYQIKFPPVSAQDADIQDVYSLRLFDKDTGVHVGLTDVGFGLSQVLPVIVQSVVSQEKTILIEQPEYHLHPRLQAELGDMFIVSALGEQKNTFLIETHSEHLILRIMRRMRETFEGRLPEGLPPLKPEDVAVVYVEKDGDQSIIREMPLNERGELVKAWPGGFFEEGFREVMA